MGSFSNQSQAENKLQLNLGDTVSVYSEKAYRRDNGSYFEAVGNVIIISGKDTMYGEKASLNAKTGQVTIEGSVRYIGQNITIYGSKIELNMQTNALEMINARMITPDFSIVASQITKQSDKVYYAKDAEFTTCRDCKESWLVSGKEVIIELERYVTIYHALMKVKGIDVLYFPYIALPIKNKRESGLLFPTLETRVLEGFIYEQPIFWAIDETQDATFSPTFLGERGLGIDMQYRKAFAEKNWLEINSKMTMDTIYVPGERNTSRSGRHTYRHFFDIENHTQWDNSLSHHLHLQGVKDLDFYRDFNYYTDELISDTNTGLDLFINKRWDLISASVETNYKRNILVADPNEFDKQYVQTLPSLRMSVMPQVLYQQDQAFLYKISAGADVNLSAFKQMEREETNFFRNANRADVSTYMNLNWVNYGPINLNSKLSVDYQEYDFADKDEINFYKHTTFVSTELNFTLDKVFGLAFEESYEIDEFQEKDLIKFKGLSENKEKKIKGNTIGELPDFGGALTKESIKVKSHSYRHSQDFKFIHHRIVSSDENGNSRFESQINEESGWFDYRDAVIRRLDELQSNETRTSIPLFNTFELQWNNSLMKKSPRDYRYLEDEKYLKDMFDYATLGTFNISQGVLLENESADFKEKLTRLKVDGSYVASTWSVSFSDFYFHQSNDNVFSLNGQKKFERLSLLGQYNENTFDGSRLKTLRSGIQFRPHDVLGFSYLRDYDLDADENVSTIYQVDFMPHNNCWIINLNYRENFIEQRFAFNFEFNFGSDEFDNYKNNFWGFGRLR